MNDIDRKVININYPCIQDIIIRKDETDVCFTITDGQDETKLFLKDGQEVMFTVNFGDVSNIGFGGTDNWGKDRLPIYIGYENESVEYDSVLVDTIEIQEYAGDGDWCKCELINDGKAVKYTALSENPYNVERTAYFYFETDDDTIKIGDNEGRPASKEWCVTVIQELNPDGKPLPKPEDCEVTLEFLTDIPGTGFTESSYVGKFNLTGDCDFPTHIEYVDGDGDFIGEDYTINGGGGIWTKIGENPLTRPRTSTYSVKYGDKVAYAEISQLEGSGDEPEPPVPPIPEPDETMSFDELIDTFNTLINSLGKNEIDPSMDVYDYLKNLYDMADEEWNDEDSELFSKETYKEIYDYRGDNKEYESLSYNAMQAWLMAMAISELIPTAGELTNNQTELFKLAYEIGGGREIPLYGDYDMRSDVMIARLVAGTIYALNRGKFTFEDMNVFRDELGGESINAYDWNGLGYWSEDKMSIGEVGYVVNSDVIIPSAPGPYTVDSDPDRPKPFEEGQPEDQFYMEDDGYDWHLYNYKKDVEIDNYIVENYNMGSDTYNPEIGSGLWETYDKDKKLTLIHAAVMPFATDHYFFGSKRIKFDGVYYNDKYDYWRYTFNETIEDVTDDNDVFEVSGPFSQFKDVLFTNGYDITPTMEFINVIMDMADNSRYPTYHTEYGRRRPLGGMVHGTARAGEINGHPLNGMLNGNIAKYFADNESQYESYEDCDDFPHDGPRTYPSGHATMTWTDAMLFTQMFGDKSKAVEFMKAAYQIGVGRTIARYHWNSDTIYGRLFATFILPIINAMDGADFQAQYESAKSILTTVNDPNDWKVNLIIENYTGEDIYSTGEIRMYIGNHELGVNMYLPGAKPEAGPLYTFNVGETDFIDDDIHCAVNGGGAMYDYYDGEPITEVRFYDYRHWNSIDCGWNATLDGRGDMTLKKSGATYVIKIENL